MNRYHWMVSKSKLITVLICVTLYSCDNNKGNQIIDQAIEQHGGEAYEVFELAFDFRDRHYTVRRNQGIFEYTREFSDSTGNIKDVLNNSGLQRYRNGKLAELTDERRNAFKNSVNSVIYFALLPFGLNDDVVNKEWIRETTIKGEPYDLIHVTFDAQGGDNDHQDEFLYWIHRDKKTMDYMAYTYETDGGGLRFREAVNPRKTGGILLQDYVNYKPADETISLEQIQALFTSGKLETLSRIELKNIKVGEGD